MDDNSVAVGVYAKNGNVHIKADNGDIILEGKNIKMWAHGEENDDRGIFQIEANKEFKLDTPTVTDLKGAWTGTEADETLITKLAAGADPTYDHNVDGTSGYLELEVVIENDATAGDINFQFAQAVSNANATKLLRGSYVEYRRF